MISIRVPVSLELTAFLEDRSSILGEGGRGFTEYRCSPFEGILPVSQHWNIKNSPCCQHDFLLFVFQGSLFWQAQEAAPVFVFCFACGKFTVQITLPGFIKLIR